MRRKVRWRPANNGFVESHCGRYQISPLYWGCTRPQVYELRVDGEVVASYCANQREAKDCADDRADDLTPDGHGDPRLPGHAPGSTPADAGGYPLARAPHPRVSMAKLSPVDQERLDVVHHLAGRLLAGLKTRPLAGAALERMRLIEQAVTCLETARLR